MSGKKKSKNARGMAKSPAKAAKGPKMGKNVRPNGPHQEKSGEGQVSVTGPAGADRGEAGLDVADTMAAASALLGLPMAALKWAKGEACPAFRGSRVYLAEFRTWWEANGDRLGQEVREGLPEEEYDRLLKKQKFESKIKDDAIRDGKYIEVDKARRQLEAVSNELRGTLRARLENELPFKLVGLDVIGMRELMGKTVDELFGQFAGGVAGLVPAAEWFYEI